MENAPKQIRAVLFDCDGVIIDSAADISDAVNATLAKHGMETVSNAKLKTYVGNGAALLVERAIKTSKGVALDDPLPITQEEFKKISADYVQYYYSHAVVKTKLYPGFAELLKKLKSAGICTGVVTNKPIKILKEILNHFEIENFFDALICPEQVKNLKPAPDGIFAALEKINAKIEKEVANNKGDFVPITAAETIMIGDSYTDIGAGHAAGTLTAACLNGMGDKEKMLAEKPEIQIGYAAEIFNAANAAIFATSGF